MDRTTRVVILLFLLFALVCTQIPLFNYLGFEYSALSALVCSLITGLAVFSWFKPGKTMGEFWGSVRDVVARIGILLLLPFFVMLLNAVFVKNCALIGGIGLFLLIVPAGVLLSASLSIFIAVTDWRFKRTLFAVVYILILLHIVVVTVTGPQIYAFNPIIGYFPGVTYDESLRIESRLIVYRLGTIAYIGLLFLAAYGRWQWRVTRAPGLLLRERFRRLAVSKLQISGAVVCIVVAGTLLIAGEGLGLRSSDDHVRDVLGGIVEGEYVTLVYPSDEVNDSDAMNLLNLHEFLYARLARELRIGNLRRITSFVYASPDQKGYLIGAGRTNIAKPWLWQVHVNLEDVGDVLKHEMTHVVAADFGFPLFRVGLNPGLIEGLAVAVEHEAYDEPLHRMAAQICALGISPDIETLFSIRGFIQAQPTVSYTLAGSFCRFLIDTYGIRRFKRLYKSGSFESVYRKPPEQLIRLWKRSLEKYSFTDDELRRASFLFNRPTIFMKECVRVIAELNEETATSLRNNQYESALESSDRSLELTNNPTAVILHARVLVGLKRYEEARRFAGRVLADSAMIQSLYPLYLTVGDAEWGMGDRAAAAKTYTTLRSIHLSSSWDEACEVRLRALQNRRLSDSLFSYFMTAHNDSLRLVQLGQLREQYPQESLLLYLTGNAFLRKNDFQEAATSYQQAAFEDGILEFHRLQRLGYVSFRLRRYQSARIFYWQSLNYTDNEAVMFKTREMIERCEWTQARIVKSPHAPL